MESSLYSKIQIRSLKSNESHSIGVVFDYEDQDLVALAALIFDSCFSFSHVHQFFLTGCR